MPLFITCGAQEKLAVVVWMGHSKTTGVIMTATIDPVQPLMDNLDATTTIISGAIVMMSSDIGLFCEPQVVITVFCIAIPPFPL